MAHRRRIHAVRMIGLWTLFTVYADVQASGTTIEQVEFVEAYRVDQVVLRLHNVGLMRYKLVIKALVAGLYVAEGTPPSQVLSNVPKRLEIEYFWSLQAKDIVKASEKLLAENVDPRRLSILKPQIDRMSSLYEDIRPGDRYTLTFLPGQGTTLTLNGQFKGIVPGDDFAAAYFSIWLGDQPMDLALKSQLLGRR